MPDEYIARTLNAYNADPKKYEDATKDMVLHDELDEFLARIPNKEFPILDAGCAFGRDTNLFTKRGFEVEGIDMSSGLIKRAKELYPDLSFQEMDIRHLKFPDETFSAIWCNATILHLKDQDITKTLNEFRRVLIPGGVIAVSVKEGIGEEEFIEKFSSNSARYFNYQTMDTLRLLVEGSGFKVVKIYTINEREKYGPKNRDLNWIYCFAIK